MRIKMLVAALLVVFAGGCGGGSQAAAPAAPEPANEAPPAPAEITCDQVADRAMALIWEGLEAQAAGMTEEEKANGRAAAEQAAPAIRADLVKNCQDANWSQADRRCVMDAQNVDQASQCGN